ncbi:MAG: hypothetical protein JXA92_03500 [candidate division Zixibacteria bacterium]|nr:hypothetical protein [candidate division Zixibacteria bacterium]
MTKTVETPASKAAKKIGAKVGGLIKGVKMIPGFAYLQFLYLDANDKKQPLPKGTPVRVYYQKSMYERITHSKFPLLLTGDKGKLSFKLEQNMPVSFEIEFDDKKLKYFFNVTKKSIMTSKEVDQALKDKKLDFTKEQLFQLPLKIDLRNAWWEIVADNYDIHSRSFKPNAKKQFEIRGKKKGEYLPVILKPEWQHLAFRYLSPEDKKNIELPPSLVLEAVNEKKGAEPVVRSSLYDKAKKRFLIPYIEISNQSLSRDPDKFNLKFYTTNQFVESGTKIIPMKLDDYLKKSVKDRRKYFDLPAKWEAKNWILIFGSQWKKFKDVVKEKTTLDKPLQFYLDLVIPTDKDLKSTTWGGTDRFTAFDEQMIIQKPETDKPYWSSGIIQGTVDKKFILPGFYPRVIAHDGKFYDVTYKRSKEGDVIGARAAVLDDEEVHHGEALKGPVYTYIGNFDLHYFKDCLDPKGNDDTTYLMIYWSCEFHKESHVTDNDVKNFRKKGLTNSKERWESKAYNFQPKTDPKSKKITVYPVHFFEGREDSKFKCTVNIHNPKLPNGNPNPDFRSNMGLTEGNFARDVFEPQHQYGSHNENGFTYDFFTMAHELGHATGLHDEYAEPELGGKWPITPKFDQYYKGMPYNVDEHSMMRYNQAMRLRHFWYFCRWLNEKAGIKKLTSNTVFQVMATKGKKYKYYLENKYKNFYEKAYEEDDYTNADGITYDLYLYKLGEDETTDILVLNKQCQGILVVRSKLQFFYEDYSSGGVQVQWTDDIKKNNMLNFQTLVNKYFNNKVCLECSADGDFKRVYVHFMPHYKMEGTTTSDHFEITFKAHPETGKIKYAPDFDTNDFYDDEFEVDMNQSVSSIMRYMLGMKPYNQAKLKDTDLADIVKWINAKRSKTFTAKVK